jgi:hypothetical protein
MEEKPGIRFGIENGCVRNVAIASFPGAIPAVASGRIAIRPYRIDKSIVEIKMSGTNN